MLCVACEKASLLDRQKEFQPVVGYDTCHPASTELVEMPIDDDFDFNEENRKVSALLAS